jgi:hypothetical protein
MRPGPLSEPLRKDFGCVSLLRRIGLSDEQVKELDFNLATPEVMQ